MTTELATKDISVDGDPQRMIKESRFPKALSAAPVASLRERSTQLVSVGTEIRTVNEMLFGPLMNEKCTDKVREEIKDFNGKMHDTVDAIIKLLRSCHEYYAFRMGDTAKHPDVEFSDENTRVLLDSRYHLSKRLLLNEVVTDLQQVLRRFGMVSKQVDEVMKAHSVVSEEWLKRHLHAYPPNHGYLVRLFRKPSKAERLFLETAPLVSREFSKISFSFFKLPLFIEKLALLVIDIIEMNKLPETTPVLKNATTEDLRDLYRQNLLSSSYFAAMRDDWGKIDKDFAC
ncbi:hypothetical protein FRC17_008828 [Serendipita sp. 399]|nr:hypothetical protein FRC17_008828 [Serendipita sp. 399]